MKVWNYVVISLGLILALHLTGFPTGADRIFNIIGLSFTEEGEIANVTTSATGIFETLFSTTDDGNDLTGILVAVLASIGAVIAGLLTRARIENLILLPLITGTLALFVMTFVTIMQYSLGTGQSWFGVIVTLLFLPITVGFVIALAEFFRGTD